MDEATVDRVVGAIATLGMVIFGGFIAHACMTSTSRPLPVECSCHCR